MIILCRVIEIGKGKEKARAAHRTRIDGFYGRVLRINTRPVGASRAQKDGPSDDGYMPSSPVRHMGLTENVQIRQLNSRKLLAKGEVA